MASSSTISEAARSTGPVVEKSQTTRFALPADVLGDGVGEGAEGLGPGVVGRALHEVVAPDADGRLPLVADELPA